MNLMVLNAALDLFYAGLFAPGQTYRYIAEHVQAEQIEETNRLMGFSALVVCAVSVITAFVSFKPQGINDLHQLLAIHMPTGVVLGLLTWFVLSVLLGMGAYIFTGKSKLRLCLALTGMAALPWVFLAPLSLLRVADGLGYFLFSLGSMLLWLWNSALFMLALTTTYKLTLDRVILLLVLPFLLIGIAVAWLLGFLVNIQNLLP